MAETKVETKRETCKWAGYKWTPRRCECDYPVPSWVVFGLNEANALNFVANLVTDSVCDRCKCWTPKGTQDADTD